MQHFIFYMSIRFGTMNDVNSIYNLYKAVAKSNPGTLTQEEDEITIE